MPITNADIYPLARWLHALIPAPLQRWTGEPNHPGERDRLANLCLDISHDAFEGNEDDDENTEMIGQMTVQSEALAGVVQEQECISSNAGTPITVACAPHTSLAGCASWRCRS